MHGQYSNQQLTEPVTGLYHHLHQNIVVNQYGLRQMYDTASSKLDPLKGKSKEESSTETSQTFNSHIPTTKHDRNI